MSGALHNIRVLDLTHVLAGPFCSYQLGLLGADVIKIEAPNAPDCARGRGPDDALNAQGLGLNYQVQGANKRALALDLKAETGRDVLRQLVKGADVLVENYTSGALARLGITGYGDTGPKAAHGAYDNVIQAVSGTIAQCGGVKPGVSFVDYSTGYAAAFAISSALVQRGQTSRGCQISVSMLEVAMQMMAPEVAATKHGGQARAKEPGIAAYDTSDGRIMLGAFQPAQYRKLAEVVGIPELAEQHDWPDVWGISDETRAMLIEQFAAKPSAEWIALLRAAALPVEPVLDLAEAVASEQLTARGFFVEDQGASLPISAFHMSEGGATFQRSAPKHGEQSREILRELGLSSDEVADLAAQGVIR